MQYHEVKINVEFEQATNMVADGAVPAVQDLDASLWVDYIYLDTDERRRFAQLSHEYLIEQLQFTGSEQVTAANNRIRMNFNHPCKELIWVISRDTVGSNQWTNYATMDYSSNTMVGYSNNCVQALIQLNGHDRFYVRSGQYFNLVQPYQHHENIPSNLGINVYSFAIKPEEHQPSGTLNMSRIDTATLSVTSAVSGTIDIYAVNSEPQKAARWGLAPCKTGYAASPRLSRSGGGRNIAPLWRGTKFCPRRVRDKTLGDVPCSWEAFRALSTKDRSESAIWPGAKPGYGKNDSGLGDQLADCLRVIQKDLWWRVRDCTGTGCQDWRLKIQSLLKWEFQVKQVIIMSSVKSAEKSC